MDSWKVAWWRKAETNMEDIRCGGHRMRGRLVGGGGWPPFWAVGWMARRRYISSASASHAHDEERCSASYQLDAEIRSCSRRRRLRISMLISL